jgi:6,7-dimethyl-8-ribityllumazine synthase
LIRSIGLKALAKSPEEFSALVKLLKALGIRSDLEGENEKYRYVDFAPDSFGLSVVYGDSPGWCDLFLSVSHPDTAFEVIKKLGFQFADDPPVENLKEDKPICVVLPGGTRVGIWGLSNPFVTHPMPAVSIRGHLDATGKKFCVVVSTFNAFITERLLSGAVDLLLRLGAETPMIVRVPGAFEIPSAARTLALTKKYDAIICLGCLLRGDTAHYDVIVNEVTRGIGQSAQETGVPHAFGVLTCDTLEQAIDRAGLKMGNKGFEAAMAAVEMASLKKAIGSLHSKQQVPRTARNDDQAKARRAPASKSRRSAKKSK